MRISDWSSDVCSSDLRLHLAAVLLALKSLLRLLIVVELALDPLAGAVEDVDDAPGEILKVGFDPCVDQAGDQRVERSEEHTSELQSLMRISYAVFCLKKKTHKNKHHNTTHSLTLRDYTIT